MGYAEYLAGEVSLSTCYPDAEFFAKQAAEFRIIDTLRITNARQTVHGIRGKWLEPHSQSCLAGGVGNLSGLLPDAIQTLSFDHFESLGHAANQGDGWRIGIVPFLERFAVTFDVQVICWWLEGLSDFPSLVGIR